MAFIKAESQGMAPKETGGLLLGYWADEDVVVTIATGPGPRSKHKLYSYDPDPQFDIDQVAKVYEETSGVITYLGDWHSHPKGGSGLSRDDIITLFNTATYEPARASIPIMLIAAKDLNNWMPAVWKNEILHVGEGEYYSQLSPLKILSFSS